MTWLIKNMEKLSSNCMYKNMRIKCYYTGIFLARVDFGPPSKLFMTGKIRPASNSK